MSRAAPPDQSARVTALDARRSFIVRAPAGSGKTELLIQRHLRLLACVEEPEEVLAITFTRKAAAEMRDRIVSALETAAGAASPPARMDPRTLELARAVLGDPARRAWNLEQHPARLNVGTIDAVNAWLAGRAPLRGPAALQRVTSRPDELYDEAARATLLLAGDDGPDGEQARTLLRHLDNDADRFVALLAALLPRREQWLRQVLRAERRRVVMEAPLRSLVERGLGAVAAAWPGDCAAELVLLLNHAARNGAAAGWGERDTPPRATADDLAAWRAVANATLTGEGAWRRRIDATCGFPRGDPLKPRMVALVGRLESVAGLDRRLSAVRDLPDPAYPDAQWAVLNALLDLLPVAAGLLAVEFSARGQADFPAVAAAAAEALGTPDTPSELGLALDVRIRHVLVDEFQDTSRAQLDLLEQLLSGWEPGDGRTLFLVGDPMQSIYGFRDADVRLFAVVEEEGIGPLRPAPLQLRANFRSLPALVAWVNDAFARLLPAEDDRELGAVAHAPAVAARTAEDGGTVAWHWVPAGASQEAARVVVDCALSTREAHPGDDVCVLVRARPHAAAVIAELRRRQVAFSAPEVENLGNSTVAQDLLALTRALCHRADRLAWLALLRAPFCGLSLAALAAVAEGQRHRDVWTLLHDPAVREGLDEEALRRAGRVVGAVERARTRLGRWRLRDVVEAAWLELGGPACVDEETGLDTAVSVFEALDEFDAGGDLADAPALTARLAGLTGSRGDREAWLQVMTIHQAKGLEFGTVIVPFLERRVRGNPRELLLWHDMEHGAGHEPGGTIFATLPEEDADAGRLYDTLRELRRQRDAFEAVRLLYVACTRARRGLHLVASLATDTAEDGSLRPADPARGSLLAHLWPVARDEATRGCAGPGQPAPADRREPAWAEVAARRLPDGWCAPAPPPAWTPPGAPPALESAAAPEFDWASRWAMHAGAVVHRWLQEIADTGLARWTPAAIEAQRPVVRDRLAELGTPVDGLDAAEERVVAALVRTLGDERGRWVLGGDHAEARSELALTVESGGRFEHVVLDRTFVDAAGNRWVIDYKTSAHEGGDLEAFLDLECERYRGQLARYREALAGLGGGPVRTALYFPLLGRFREVVPGDDGPQSDPANVTA